MKIALCFIISYEHILNKEEIWKEWIQPNKDIINIYFYYKDLKKTRYLWLKNQSNLSELQNQKINDLATSYPRLGKAYRLKE